VLSHRQRPNGPAAVRYLDERSGPDHTEASVVELMPFVATATVAGSQAPAAWRAVHDAAGRRGSWRPGLPVLRGTGVTLRELRPSDAPALLATFAAEEVSRHISSPPDTREGFEQFIAWAHRKRRAGTQACFVVVPDGATAPVGLMQLRQIGSSFTSAEWGFAIASSYWGTGLFQHAATEVLSFAFDTLGVQRLEARASVEDGRGNAALRKMGAVRELVLTRSFTKNGRSHDQALWVLSSNPF